MNNLFFLVTLLLLPFHDFHVTHTTFHYNDESKSIEITIKVAIEDLERSLENEYSKPLSLETKQENKRTEKIITEYFRNHLQFLTNDKNHEYQWVGKEVSDNLHDVYLYFETRYDDDPKLASITVKNTLFLEVYSDQTNIVLIEFEDEKYNLTFTKDNEAQSLFINNGN